MKQASEDEERESIKITLYRISKYLKLKGLFNISSRKWKRCNNTYGVNSIFYEENNIEWAQKFQEAGCRVIYGADKYKVHSKICQITYRRVI